MRFLAQFFQQVGVPGQRIDEHAGLRLESQHDALRVCVIQHVCQTAHKPRKRLALPCPVVHHARPQRHALGVELGGDIDRPAQKIDPPRPPIRVGAHQRGLMFDMWIEQEPATGFDHAL